MQTNKGKHVGSKDLLGEVFPIVMSLHHIDELPLLPQHLNHIIRPRNQQHPSCVSCRFSAVVGVVARVNVLIYCRAEDREPEPIK